MIEYPPDMDIDALLPHRPPMQLLTRLLATAEDQVWSAVALQVDSPFVTTANRSVAATTLLEYLAQTAAAFFSLQARSTTPDQGGAPVAAPRPGMLIGCSRLDCAVPAIAVPTTLVVQANLASALPETDSASALVRFTGKVFNLEHQSDSAESGIAMVEAAQRTVPAAEAAFSVYLPAAATE